MNDDELMMQDIHNRMLALKRNPDYDHAHETADMLLLDTIRMLSWLPERVTPQMRLSAEMIVQAYEVFRQWSWDK